MTSIERWTEDNHKELIARIMDAGSAKTPTQYACMKEIEFLRCQRQVLLEHIEEQAARSSRFAKTHREYFESEV
jgi:hypothetical protein